MIRCITWPYTHLQHPERFEWIIVLHSYGQLPSTSNLQPVSHITVVTMNIGDIPWQYPTRPWVMVTTLTVSSSLATGYSVAQTQHTWKRTPSLQRPIVSSQCLMWWVEGKHIQHQLYCGPVIFKSSSNPSIFAFPTFPRSKKASRYSTASIGMIRRSILRRIRFSISTLYVGGTSSCGLFSSTASRELSATFSKAELDGFSGSDADWLCIMRDEVRKLVEQRESESVGAILREHERCQPAYKHKRCISRATPSPQTFPQNVGSPLVGQALRSIVQPWRLCQVQARLREFGGVPCFVRYVMLSQVVFE